MNAPLIKSRTNMSPDRGDQTVHRFVVEQIVVPEEIRIYFKSLNRVTSSNEHLHFLLSTVLK